jgi:hypothetical protein
LAAARAGINKRVGVHTLRHSFATCRFRRCRPAIRDDVARLADALLALDFWQVVGCWSILWDRVMESDRYEVSLKGNPSRRAPWLYAEVPVNDGGVDYAVLGRR